MQSFLCSLSNYCARYFYMPRMREPILSNKAIVSVGEVQHANSKAANFGDCDYDHDTHANGFIFFMVDP